MPKDKRYHPPEEETTDPYTGEEKPVPEDARIITVETPRDPGEHRGKNYLLEEETSMDATAADGNSDEAAQEAARYSSDEDIKTEFVERQSLGDADRKALEQELEEYHSRSPKLSGGDLDADWQSANQAGEETVGGSNPTPDQDRVDELGRAVGLTYSDDEPLDGEEKLRKRDQNRWELNPASADDLDQADQEPPEGEEQGRS